MKEIDDAILELKGLLDNSDANFKELKETYEKLPKHNRVLFEYVDYKDPLHLLMTGQVSEYDIEKRRYMLDDYFEGEWESTQLR